MQPKSVVAKAASQSRKRKSGTPRKLEVIDKEKMDSWETAADTEILKNSSNDHDYIIKERKLFLSCLSLRVSCYLTIAIDVKKIQTCNDMII